MMSDRKLRRLETLKRYRLRKKFGSDAAPRLTARHGHAPRANPSPEYTAYANMIGRCYDKKRKQYHLWGGKGITVCDRWRSGADGKSGFECFLADVGPKPSPKHEIDRIDPDRNYEPGNVSWSTKEEAVIHSKRTVRITLPDGRTVSRSAFEREIGWYPGEILGRAKALNRLLTRIARTVR